MQAIKLKKWLLAVKLDTINYLDEIVKKVPLDFIQLHGERNT